MDSHISSAELIDGIKEFFEAIWEIDINSGEAYIWQDHLHSEYIGTYVDCNKFLDHFIDNFIAPIDRELCRSSFSIDALSDFATSNEESKIIELRVRTGNESKEPVQWFELRRQRILDDNKTPIKVVLYVRFIGDERRNKVLSQAIKSEYDYIMYIEADLNSYILYSYDNGKSTRLPAAISTDYYKEMSDFAKKYSLGHRSDWTLSNMKLDFAISELHKKNEHIFYYYMFDLNNKLAYKKLRYSWFDKSKNIILLTRIDVTAAKEEKRQKELLISALNTANVANKAKTEFLSRMSHDIRTPLNAIIGMASIAEMHLDDKDRVIDSLGKISVSSKHLLGLLSDILDMAKIESGKDQLREQNFFVSHLVQSLYPLILPEIQDKDHKFKTDTTQVINNSVFGDYTHLQQVLINLLSNAAKYTHQNGNISLTVKESPAHGGYGFYEFIVKDNGIGIKKEFIQELFTPFERGSSLEVKNIDGTGLGLAISKNLVEMMGGNINVESDYGNGSAFTVALKLKHSNEIAPVEDKEEKVEKVHDFSKSRILLVEDNLLNMEIGAEFIRYAGAQVEKAENGKIALDKILGSPEGYYSMVFMDIQMPVMDGYEAASTIRMLKRQDTATMPIVAMTANAFADDVQKALQAGMDQHISKPVTKYSVAAAIKRWIG